MSNGINWDLMNQQQQTQQQRMGDAVDREKSPFIKFSAGMHRVRPLPVGNFEDNIPYKSIKQHCVNKTSEGKRIPFFSLCWNWLFEPTQQHNTLKPLGLLQKLTKADFGLYQKHGCPFCRAIKAMDAGGIDKQFSANLTAKATFLWNVVKRAEKNSDQVDTAFVWSMSSKLHVQLRDMLLESQQAGLNILDTTSGFDWSVTATGEQLQRRYTLNMFPVPCPVTGDIVPFNLMEIAARSFRTYQETIDLLKVGAGQYLTQIGYVIPADQTYENMTGTVPTDPIQPEYTPPPAVLPAPVYHVPAPSPQVQQQRQAVVNHVAQQTSTVPAKTEVIDDKFFLDGVEMF